jgi:hypothetical protein
MLQCEYKENHMAKLTSSQRRAIPKSDFAVPGKASTPQGKAKSGSFPIPDANHARNALARASGKPVAGQVRAAVKAKFPNIGKSVANIKARISSHNR